MGNDVDDQSDTSAERVTPGRTTFTPRGDRHIIDLVVGATAIIISIISLAIAVAQSRTMQKQVAAASWPLLQYASDNTSDNGLRISLNIENAGVGPAIIKRFRVLYGGKAYLNPYELVRDCCNYLINDPDPRKVAPGAPTSRPIQGTVIRSGQSNSFFSIGLGKGNEDAWKKLDAVRFKLQFDVCYCSVLEECWQSDLIGTEPKPVKSCLPEGTARL